MEKFFFLFICLIYIFNIIIKNYKKYFITSFSKNTHFFSVFFFFNSIPFRFMQITQIIDFFKEKPQRIIFVVILLIGLLFDRRAVVFGNSLVGKLFFIFSIIWFTMKLGHTWGLIMLLYFIHILHRGSHADNLKEGFEGAAADGTSDHDDQHLAAEAASGHSVADADETEVDAVATAATKYTSDDSMDHNTRSPIEIENELIRPNLSNDSYEENVVSSSVPLITSDPAAVNMNELSSSSLGSI